LKKTVLITGISKGLGKALALEFQKKGFQIAGISRTKPDFEIDFFYPADITVKEEREKSFSQIIEKCGNLDVLINNAGIGYYEAWEKVNETDLKKTFDLDFFSLVWMTQLSLPYLKKTKGTIINISSVAGKTVLPYMGPYSAVKSAVNYFSDSLRIELKNKGVKVLNVCPGRIKTGFGERVLGSRNTTPSTPFKADSSVFAEKCFKAYQKNRRELIFPAWYRFFIGFTKIFTQWYEKISLKKWNKDELN